MKVKNMKNNTIGTLNWMRISRFKHQSDILSNEFLKQFDLTVAQFEVLSQISVYQPMTQSELAQKITVTQGGISKMLTRLEDEGSIKREREWKTKWISLTDKGMKKIDDVMVHQVEYQTSLFDKNLTQEEQKELYRMMSKLQKYTEAEVNKKNL